MTPQSTLPNFFANLLPEGYRLNALATSLKTSKNNELGLLLALGADVPGDIQVVSAGEAPLEVLAVLVTDAESVSFHDLMGVIDRKSLPGVQTKFSARVSTLMRTLPVNWRRILTTQNPFFIYAFQSAICFQTTSKVARKIGRAHV